MISAMATWLKRLLWGLAALVVVGAGVYAWMPRPLKVETGEVFRGKLTVTVDEDGKTRLENTYVVSAPLRGVMSRIDLESGDEIESGDLITRVEPPESPLLDPRARQTAEARVETARAAVRQAESRIDVAKSALERAKTELQRAKNLFDEGVGTRQTLEQARFDVESREAELASAQFAERVARHELQAARAALEQIESRDEGEAGERLSVKAPVSGTVLEVLRESSGPVEAGAPLVEIGRLDSLEIVVDVLTSDAVKIEPNDRVTIERWGGDEDLEGHVRRIEPEAFTKISSLGVEEQRTNVVIDIDSPREKWRQLGDGFRIEARIVTWEAEEILQVDASALFRSGDGWAVFRAVNGTARLTPVDVGRRTETHAQILDGLEHGQRVILYPNDAITDGADIEK